MAEVRANRASIPVNEIKKILTSHDASRKDTDLTERIDKFILELSKFASGGNVSVESFSVRELILYTYSLQFRNLINATIVA